MQIAESALIQINAQTLAVERLLISLTLPRFSAALSRHSDTGRW
jgi:hypothetical protein